MVTNVETQMAVIQFGVTQLIPRKDGSTVIQLLLEIDHNMEILEARNIEQ